MKRNYINRGLLLAALLATPATLFAQAPDWITKAPGQERYPRQEAICLKHEVTHTLLADGRRRQHVFMAIKVLRQTPYNRQGLADPRIHFDHENQTIKVLKARVWTPAGKAVDTGKNGMNIVFPDALVSAPDLARFRDLVVTHVGIREGCTTVLEYELTDKQAGDWPFEGSVPAQIIFPVLSQKIVVEAPGSTTLQASLIAPKGRTTTPIIENQEKAIRFVFTRNSELPAATAGTGDLVIYGTRPWEFLGNQLKKRLTGMGPLPTNLLKQFKPTGKHPLSPLQRARSVAKSVNKALRIQAWPINLLNWRVRSCQRIWHSTYATSLEMAGFLAHSLKTAGFSAAMVVPIADRPLLDVPCLAITSQFWVVAFSPAHPPIWIKPGGTPGIPATTSLIGSSILLGPTPPLQESKGLVELKGHVRISSTGTTYGDLEIRLRGTALNPTLATMKGLAPQISPLVTKLAGAEVSKLNVLALSGNEAQVSAHYKNGTLGQDGAGLFRFTLPLPPDSPAHKITGLHQKTRSTPVTVPGGGREEILDLIINPSRSLEVLTLPATLEVTNPLGTLRIKTEKVGERSLRILYRLKINQTTVTPAGWPHLRALLASLQSPGNISILLAKKEGK